MLGPIASAGPTQRSVTQSDYQQGPGGFGPAPLPCATTSSAGIIGGKSLEFSPPKEGLVLARAINRSETPTPPRETPDPEQEPVEVPDEPELPEEAPELPEEAPELPESDPQPITR
jgi:hypothetical protein